ncbi:MAG TPA: hypothetical protein VFJ94_11835 [Intrasporangium sp.]|uniref:hypothetical protein n=1 Tax=Intrasporangium sp. TaxID=1925024 RepID=UPI002D7847EC|nr:hypothetical protein [Intrasporangium sp.]HET7399199.1 hypothetical protein [Intrasporangium sp.]
MSSGGPGRLFVVTGFGSDLAAVAIGLAGRSERAVAVEAEAFDRMVVAGRAPADPRPEGRRLTPTQLRLLLLRWSAAIATAETYQLEGFDAVISDAGLGPHLDDFLDLVAPAPVHLVVLQDARGPGPDTPRYGLWLDVTGQSVEEVLDEVLGRLDDALVVTAEGSQ